VKDPRGGDPGDPGGDEDPDRGQQERRLPHRPDRVHAGLQPAVEEDEGERQRADRVRGGEVVEVDPADAVFAGEHADAEKDDEHRQPEACGQLAGDGADHQQHGAEQDQAIDQEHRALERYCT
jgi:hypothetical protein